MPAKKASFGAEFFPDDEAEYQVQHNPGSDFLPMLKRCAEAPAAKFNAVFTAYSRNPIAILLGAAAIEAYTNYAGSKRCKDWQEIISRNRSFPEKLKHLLSSGNKPTKHGERVYQDTIKLINFRGRLAHPKFVHVTVVRKGPPPDLFDDVDADYPAATVLAIATKFKEALLKDLDLEDASLRTSFVSPPAPPAPRK
jgi:hypothetical protein